MEYRLLGQTGLKVSLMGFGGIPIQRLSEEAAVKVVCYGLEKGINFFDTARAYTDSEVKIGRTLQGKREKVVLATKSLARSYENIKKDIQTSLKNLNVDYIDLYQCHNIRTEEELDRTLAPKGALEALVDARKEGLIKDIGITGHQYPLLIKGIQTKQFATVQFPYNFIERDAEKELLPLASTLKMGIIVMKPLAGGAFNKVNLALKFLLQKDVSTIIPGMESLEQIEQNVNLAEEIKNLTVEEVQQLQKEAEAIGNYFCRRCEYCKPCPQGIDITSTLLFHAYYERYGLAQWAKERYQAMNIKADSCVECGLCESRCPYALPIRKMLKKVTQDLS